MVQAEEQVALAVFLGLPLQDDLKPRSKRDHEVLCNHRSVTLRRSGCVSAEGREEAESLPVA